MKRRITACCAIAVLLFALSSFSFGQTETQIITNYLREHSNDLKIKATDIDFIITNHHTSKQNGVDYVYISQMADGIEIFNATAVFAIKDGRVLSMSDRLLRNIAGKKLKSSTVISPVEAILKAAEITGTIANVEGYILIKSENNSYLFDCGNLSLEPVPVQKVWFVTAEQELRLAWNLSVYTPDQEHWWSFRIDAQNGEILEKNDWVRHCSFDSHPNEFHNCSKPDNRTETHGQRSVNASGANYFVLPLPFESPNHGPMGLVTDPFDSLASPYEWHDTDGIAGAEYTITRGNNVHAYEDVSDANVPGYSTDGTGSLSFDFPVDFGQNPGTYQDVAITNLFYMNNMVHDVWYHYGFDEASGNFQSNNYGRGGLEDDYVFAEAQDGGGTNNANFATPPDGGNPTMQMYLWSGGGISADLFTVNSPSLIAGPYMAVEAAFGPGLTTTPITANLVLAVDGTAPYDDGCEALTNASQINGKIAILYRGFCNFSDKVQFAQDAGAIAIVVINNAAGDPFSMGGTSSSVTIPSVMISQSDGALILAEMTNGAVNITLVNSGTPNPDLDGDLDNGIIAHEYGHGISTRLVGGAGNSDCLYNEEQMGEGWSDWFGLMMTIKPGDQGSDSRGYGTYASGQTPAGTGIRNAPYSTNMGINPFTYDDSNDAANISVPHGVGFVWATALWDLSWAFIDLYGFDPDIHSGTGGNNMAMQLVIDGLKLTPCSPGMIDSRDAILMSDELNFSGVNKCMIWEVFARRGFGYSANQGSPDSRSDQVEAYDMPPECLIATTTPTALFEINAISDCNGIFVFNDLSTDIPQQWSWDFGDGTTSTLQNPEHTYGTDGSYTVQLQVSNTLGSDTYTLNVDVLFPAAPFVQNASVCNGNSTILVANSTNETHWFDISGQFLSTGDSLITQPITANTQFLVQDILQLAPQFVGPADTSIGTSAYHNTGYTGTVLFDAFVPLTILSAWVEASGDGDREFFLWDNANNILQSVTAFVPDGPGRIDLGFNVPGPGSYAIGGTNVNLMRNNSGTAYPYTIAGLISLTGSPAGDAYYYYLYDLEVQEVGCSSPFATVSLSVYDATFTHSVLSNEVSFSSNAPGNTYWWDFGDGNTSTLENPVHTYAANGTYYVTLFVGDDSCVATDTVVIDFVSIEEYGSINNISIQPNPAKEHVTVAFGSALSYPVDIEVISMDGKLVMSVKVDAGKQQKTIDLKNVRAGVYFIKFSDSKQTSINKLVVSP